MVIKFECDRKQSLLHINFPQNDQNKGWDGTDGELASQLAEHVAKLHFHKHFGSAPLVAISFTSQLKS